MKTVVRRLGVALAVLLLAGGVSESAPEGPAPGKVELRTLTYKELGALIKQLHGKVVVVDFWADFCIPCKSEFPKLVALQEKYGRDGLVAVSVSLDDPKNPDVRQKVEKLLEDRKATFTNVLLNEQAPAWQAALKIDGPPCVYVFNRDGQWVKKFADDVDYAEVEKVVRELLKP